MMLRATTLDADDGVRRSGSSTRCATSDDLLDTALARGRRGRAPQPGRRRRGEALAAGGRAWRVGHRRRGCRLREHGVAHAPAIAGCATFAARSRRARHAARRGATAPGCAEPRSAQRHRALGERGDGQRRVHADVRRHDAAVEHAQVLVHVAVRRREHPVRARRPRPAPATARSPRRRGCARWRRCRAPGRAACRTAYLRSRRPRRAPRRWPAGGRSGSARHPGRAASAAPSRAARGAARARSRCRRAA